QNVILKKNFFLVIVVVLIFFITAVILFGDYSSKMGNYKNENQKKMEKISRIKEYSQSKENLAKFMAAVPKSLGPDELVAQVDDFALHNHISIVNVSSKDMQKFDEYVTMEIQISVKAQNFKDMVSFFHA